jgi:hypothetical protein
MQDLSLTNPYDHPDNKAFRDPDIFPPFTVEDRQNAYLPLPLGPNNMENMDKFYATLVTQGSNERIENSNNGNYTQCILS